MSIRRVTALALIALPLSLFACEDKGIPAPLADTAQAKPKAEPAPDPAAEAKPTDTAKPADSAAKEAKADPDAEKKEDGDKEKGADGKEAPKPGAADTKTAADAKEKPAPKEAEPEPTKGEKKSAGSYAAWLQSSGKYKVDKPGAVVAVVNAQGEFKCNDKYPYKFRVSGSPAGVSFGATTVRGASIGKKSTSLRIPFTPTSAGAKTISGTFYFSVCNAETCQIKKQPMSVTVNVE